MSRRSPLLGFGLAGACLLALLLPGAARAEGSPNIGLSATGPTSVLFGAKATIILEASNPVGEPYGYNLSYRAVLPEGVAYVPGSAKLGSGGAAPTPTIIENQPKAKETTVIWSNVGDLSPDSHSTLSFEVTPSQVTYPVASEFTVPAEAFVAEAPRYLPKFSAAGKPEGPGPTSFTGYAKGSAKTAISALEIKQEEGSPEGEILRGVHDHQTVYKVTVTNNKVNSTTNVNVDDWLPAGLEYLGCGGAGTDHTTNAPTNPGSAEEYPGSGPIEVAALGGCTAPALVETLETDPDGAGEDPTAVYTHVRWNVAELKPGESRTYEFRAAVPLRENTTAWTGVKPTPASGKQGVNLDNNSGKETRDGQTLTTFAKAEGLYNGVTPVTAEEHLTRVAKDITTEKSASPGTLSDGQVTKWTILVHSSEYRYNTGVEVTDTLPNGLCPLSSTNLSNPVSAECEPNGDLPSSPYTSTKEEENGSWTLLWDETTDPALKRLKQNETTTITFYSKTRTHYQSKHKQAGPILSNDKIENKVIAAATTNVVCGNDTDCSEIGAKPINHERPLSEPVQDNSHATQTAEGPVVKKEIAESGTNCLGDTYTGATPVYHPGDLICWRLQASFPATLSTHGTQVTDFLPASVLFDEAFNAGKGEAPTSEDTLPATTFDHSEAPGSEPGGALKWTLPESGIVGNGSQRFERVFATSATLPKGSLQGDLQGNLMKFASINSAGETFALRSEADFKLQFPQLSLEKQIVKINGAVITPATSATVKGTDEAEFALTVKNSGEVAAQNTEVRDLLPNGLTCAGIVAISNKGACSGERITWGETGLGQEAIGVPANGQTVLHFTAKVPTPIDPATTLEDRAGVREYHSATNTGGEYTYIPAENIDPLLSEKEANVPAANAQAQLVTEDVKMTKTHTTSVNETGNKVNEATIGEEVTFEVSATIPAGTALSGAAKLTDPGIPTERLSYEKGSVEALVNGSAAPGTFKTEEVAGSPVVTLPENYAAPTTESVKVTMRFKTYVTNVEANNSAGVEPAKSIPNTGKLAWTNPLSGAQVREAKDSVPLVEPSIALTQSNNAIGSKVHGGQLVEYSLKLKNAAGSSTAFGNEILDTVPNGTMPANSKGEALKNGEATASGGIWNEVARTITWKLEKLEGGKEQVYAFFVTVNEAPVASTNLKNTALATTASLPTGASPATRTAANAPNASIKSRYESKTEANLEVEGSTISKAGSPEKATIGEKVTYTLTVTVPLHTVSFNETVIDTLPATLELAKYVSATCVSGCAPGPTEIEPKPYTAENNVAAHTNRVAWYLGNLTSAPEARVLKLIYVALVRSVPRGGGAEVKAPAVLENSASLYYNTADSGYAFKEATVPPATFTKTVGPVHAKTTVIEPSVAIVKEASVSGGAFSTTTPFAVTDGSTITYRLQVTNSGTAPAYNVSVTDALPASGLTEVATVANAPIVSKEAEVTKETASELAWAIPALGTPAKPGKTITLEYTAKLAPVTTLHQGQEIPNTAKVPSYFGVPAAERTGESYFKEEKIKYRSYVGNEKTLNAKVTLPTISIEKTTGAAGFPPSANAEVGQPFTWRVVVKNTSTVAAKNLKVADILPANWEYVAGSAEFSGGLKVIPTQSGALEPGRELTWSTSIELASGASTILTYQAKPTLAAESNPGSGAGHPNKNTASATVLDAAGNPEDAEGPFAAGPASAQAVLQVPVLTVTKTPVKASVPAGAEDTYTIVVTNTGAGVAREVVAEDTLQKGLIYKAGSATASPESGFSEKSASKTTIVWGIESIAAGAKVEITVPVGTEASLASATKLKNTVAVHATAAPTPVEAEGTITLTTSADLEASKEALGKGPYVPGEPLTYKIGATNKGPSVAKGVELTDELPSGETFKKASSANCKAAGQIVTCEAAELAPEAKISFEIEVGLASSAKGTIVNTVLVKSETPDPNPNNNKASAEFTPHPVAELSLVKSTLTPEVKDGQEAVFKLTATNEGPSDAAETKIVDTLPAGLTYVSSKGVVCTAKGQEVSCPLGTLDVGSHATVEVTTKASKPGTLVNSAEVSSAAEDPELVNNKAKSEVMVAPTADLQIVKTASAPTVEVDGEVTYTLAVKNAGPDAAQNTIVTDELPVGETYLSNDAGCTVKVQLVRCELKEMANAATKTIHVVVRMGEALAEHTVKNTAEVSSETYDPNLTNNTSSAEVKVPSAADVAITKTASPEAVNANGEVTYTLTVTNKGPDTAKAVTVTDSLPAGETYLHDTGGCKVSGQKLTCELGEISSGAEAHTFQIVVRVGLSLAESTVSNTAEVSSTTFDPHMANNSSTAKVNVAPAADLKITKQATPESANVGSEVEYTLHVSNEGPDTAKNALVTDELPEGEVYLHNNGGCSDTGQLVRCELHEMAKGAAKTIGVVVRLGITLAEHTVKNTAEVSSETFDPNLANNVASAEVQVPSAADVEIVKSASPETVDANGDVTYKLTVSNKGPDTAKEVLVSDELPAGETYVSVNGGCTHSGQLVSCKLGNLASGGEPIVIEIVASVGLSLVQSTVSNTAEVSSPTFDPELANNKSTAEVEVAPAADLAIVKEASPGTVKVGEEVDYTLTVRNEGPDTAKNAFVTDKLPAGETYVRSEGPGGDVCTEVGQTVMCELHEMAVSGKASTVFHVIVMIGVQLAHSTVLNTAEVGSETFDQNMSNNTSSAEVQVETAADVQIVKSASPTTVDANGEVTYTLAVSNHGPDPAKEVKVDDKLPEGEIYLSDDDRCTVASQDVSCELGELPANGEVHAIHIHVGVGLTLADSKVINTATVSSSTWDPEMANNKSEATVEVAPAADLKIVKTVPATVVELPGEATYTLAISNAGPDTATNAIVTDELPAGEEFASASGAECSHVGQVVTCSLGNMADKVTQTIELTVKVGLTLGEREVVNVAHVSSETFDPEPANNTSSAALHTGPAADMEIEKTGPASVVSATQIVWSLRVQNKGPSTAHEVIVEDPLPSGVTFTGVSPSQGEACQENGGTLRCDLGTMVDGAQAEVEVSALVTLAFGTLQNTAHVHAIEPDPDEANNSSTATTTVTAAATKPASVSPEVSVKASGDAKSPTRVTLRKRVREHEVAPGGRLDYRLIVRNTGAQAAEKLKVCDDLPEQTTVLSRGGGHLAGARICFTLATLAAGRVHTFALVLRADSDAGGQIVNHATLTGRNFDPAHARASTPVQKASLAPARENHVTG